MNDIRIVIWDCDNCIWFHLKKEPEIIARALAIAEIEEFKKQFYNFFDSFMNYFSNRKVTLNETYKILEKKIPILYFYNYSPAQFLKACNRLKFLLNEFNPDSLEVIKNLSDRGIKNIVVSDWWRIKQEEMLKTYGVLDYIEELHCCDNRYLKSNPLSASEIIKPDKREQYIIIGDSLSSDIAFANHARIKSIWFNRNGEKTNNTRYKPTFEVFSLLEIMEIV